MRTPEQDAYTRKLELMAKGLFEEEHNASPGFWYTQLDAVKEQYREKVRAMYPNPYPDKKPVVEIEIATDEELENMKKNANKKRRAEMTLVSGVQPMPEQTPTLKDLVAKVHSQDQGQYTRVEEITPELAKDILAGNTRNRSISARLVESLLRDIKEGRWILTHQGIGLASDGGLVDGQHRLTAIALSGETVRMNVTYNVDPKAFEVVDTNNRPRSQADILGLQRGSEFPSRGGAPTKMSLMTGAMKVIARLGGTPSSVRWTTSELNKMLDVFGKDAAAVVSIVNGYRGMCQAAIVGPFTLIYPMHPKFVEDTLTSMRSKVGMSSNIAAIMRALERMGRGSDQERARAALIVLRGIKAELDGETFKSFTTSRDDLGEDPVVRHFLHHRRRMGFPEIPPIAHGQTFVKVDSLKKKK